MMRGAVLVVSPSRNMDTNRNTLLVEACHDWSTAHPSAGIAIVEDASFLPADDQASRSIHVEGGIDVHRMPPRTKPSVVSWLLLAPCAFKGNAILQYYSQFSQGCNHCVLSATLVALASERRPRTGWATRWASTHSGPTGAADPGPCVFIEKQNARTFRSGRRTPCASTLSEPSSEEVHQELEQVLEIEMKAERDKDHQQAATAATQGSPRPRKVGIDRL